jgi:phosphate:Na+ symporter
MIVMTGALRDLAGNAIRNALKKLTKSPLSGALTGAASTALLQSSSAITVAAVGFVGAGLMTFPQSLGIIFGANAGTTITGWLVVLLGFKLKLGTVILPVILMGAILKLFAKDRLATIGFALAGFGLIFVGIGMLQQGMSGLEQVITPEQFPVDTWLGRLKLVLMGIVITLITQSSSAGVAVSLTALFAGAINFNQAAALVIGMDVGTTVTAAMASLGGSISSRRTGVSHVIYNICTAIGALFLLSPYGLLWEYFAPGALIANAEVALVGFHTCFNLLGMIIVLPFTAKFAYLIENIIKSEPLTYAENLDKALLTEPSVALTAILTVVTNESRALLKHVNALLTQDEDHKRINLVEMQTALDETHAYVDLIHLDKADTPQWQQLVAAIHILDHLQRLHERCDEEEYRAFAAKQNEDLNLIVKQFIRVVREIVSNIEQQRWHENTQLASGANEALLSQLAPVRDNVMSNIAAGYITVPQATQRAEAIRWLKRVSYHISRITHHLDVYHSAIKV